MYKQKSEFSILSRALLEGGAIIAEENESGRSVDNQEGCSESGVVELDGGGSATATEEGADSK